MALRAPYTRFPTTFVAAFLLTLSGAHLWGQHQPDPQDLYFPPSMSISGVGGGTTPVAVLTVRRHWKVVSILPYVFFDHPGDHTVPERYRLFNGSHGTEEYVDSGEVRSGTALFKYYDLLNIIGYRMSVHRHAYLALRGCWSAETGESSDVAFARSAVVRDYLIDSWGIPSERIVVADPARRSDSGDNAARHEEARRVELLASHWELIRPVRYSTVSHDIDGFTFRYSLQPNANSADIDSISVVLKSGNVTLGRVSVESHADSSIYRLFGRWQYFGSCDRVLAQRSLHMVSRVHMVDGTYRDSKPVFIPYQRSESESFEGMWPRDTVGPLEMDIPFFGAGDDVLASYQERLLKGVASHVDGHYTVVELSPGVDVSESPIAHADEIAYRDRRLDSRARERVPRTEDCRTGLGVATISLASTTVPERDYAGSYRRLDFNRNPIIERRTRRSRPAQRADSLLRVDLDSIAVKRQRNVVAFLRDSVGMAVSRFTVQLNSRPITMWCGGYEPAEYSYYENLPEERAYSRHVRVQLTTLGKVTTFEEAIRAPGF